jgi:hypothetical protein
LFADKYDARDAIKAMDNKVVDGCRLIVEPTGLIASNFRKPEKRSTSDSRKKKSSIKMKREKKYSRRSKSSSSSSSSSSVSSSNSSSSSSGSKYCTKCHNKKKKIIHKNGNNSKKWLLHSYLLKCLKSKLIPELYNLAIFICELSE